MSKNIKEGKYSARYFFKTNEIIKKHRPETIVTVQFFQRQDNVILCGMNEVLELLKNISDTSKYSIKYLTEGSVIKNGEVVLELEGQYKHFGLYEGVIDGILARQTSIATNARRIIEATDKKIIFMGDRADTYINQERDGYAVNLGGISTQVTKAQIEQHNGQAVGTIPHILIQMFDGDLVQTLKAYNDTFPEEDLVALVDFNNNVINDSLEILKEFGSKLTAIRIDTSDGISDAYFKNNEEYGVTPNLIKATRKALDKNNGQHVKIIVSSGFNLEKIKLFESENTPVDIYGIGGWLLKVNNNFTADAVKINGIHKAKVGRSYKQNKKLKNYK